MVTSDHMQVTISVVTGILVPICIFLLGWLMNRNREASVRQRETEERIHLLRMDILKTHPSSEQVASMMAGIKDSLSKIENRIDALSERMMEMERAYWSMPDVDRRSKHRGHGHSHDE